MSLNPPRVAETIILIPEELMGAEGGPEGFDSLLAEATDSVVICGPKDLLEAIRVVRTTPLEIQINDLLTKFMRRDETDYGLEVFDHAYFEEDFLPELIALLEQTA